MRPTLKDVAKLANVNFTLVSKYINGNPQARMTEETRQRIDLAIRELNYRPSVSARTLRSGRSRTVGLLIGDLTNAYHAHFADFALRELRKGGYQLLIAFPEEGRDEALQSLLAREVDGILCPGTPASLLPYPAVDSLGLDQEESLAQLFDHIPGHIAGLFFKNSPWQEPFERIGKQKKADCESITLAIERNERRAGLRAVCRNRPESIFSSGWETSIMLLEMLDEEFPGYEPRIFLHANCRGPFLADRRMAGVIHSSTTELIRIMCEQLMKQIGQPSETIAAQRIQTRYIPAGSEEYKKLISKHFQLT